MRSLARNVATHAAATTLAADTGGADGPLKDDTVREYPGGPDRLLRDLETLGFLFESLVVRDLRIYAQANDAWVLQFRDAGGLEVDAIVEVRSGAWMAFEVKLGQGQIDSAAATLLRFASKIDTETAGAPAMLGVITAAGYAYRRRDGIAVVPIGALGP